jgi:membrane protease YdiL (CAAX protease family)
MGGSVTTANAGRYDVYLFFTLACAITWLFDAPLALAWASHATPPAYALPMTGLGALGPTLAALLVAARRRALGGVFGGVFGAWRARPLWIVVGLAMPLAVHLPATLVEVALGGHPTHWFYPPVTPEQVAALAMFSVGEELGWRGYAYPRIAAIHGRVVGSLLLGAVWGIWHLGMLFTLERGAPGPLAVGLLMAELALWSLPMAWAFERSGRSVAVAIALHAGAHLDNVNRAPESELRLRALRFAVLVIVAALAGRSLAGRSLAKKGAVSAP